MKNIPPSHPIYDGKKHVWNPQSAIYMPSWKMMEFVNGKDDIPYMMEIKNCLKNIETTSQYPMEICHLYAIYIPFICHLYAMINHHEIAVTSCLRGLSQAPHRSPRCRCGFGTGPGVGRSTSAGHLSWENTSPRMVVVDSYHAFGPP